MVTKVGMQSHFADAAQDLLSLEYDAVEAYKAAIERLDDEQYRHRMIEFSEDHKRRIKELSGLLSAHNLNVPSGPDAKKWIEKGRVALANLMGDKNILAAMSSNEVDTNTAYERISKRDDIWDDGREVIMRGLADARKHKEWLDRAKAS